jgi:hypothetical protein
VIMQMIAAKYCRKSSLQAQLSSLETDTFSIINCCYPGFNNAVGRDSIVGISTRYGLDGPAFESRGWEQDFPHTSKLALGPNQPPIQWVTGLLPRGKAAEVWH